MNTAGTIRNFCIIAHIDHGKSTLADRMLELTETVTTRRMREQYLDTMDLERERGITIKLQPVRMKWKDTLLHLIDTPGHVDFQYEVSRSLQAVEGAILLVDATQGVQAQTLANLYLALAQDLTIIPVINKIDLPAADVPRVTAEIEGLLGKQKEDILLVSAKTGQGVPELLDRVVRDVPGAAQDSDASTRALIFDSVYDDYKGVIAYVRIVEGTLKRSDSIAFLGSKVTDRAVEVGFLNPKAVAADVLQAGDIGYIATGLKDIRQARVGDTITLAGTAKGVAPLPGYLIPQPKVFAGLYPEDGSEFHVLREALEKLQLNDSSLVVQQERSAALGQGFRCGFLGILHLEITQERLKREHNVDVVVTTPSVKYQVTTKAGEKLDIHTADAFPDPTYIAEVAEQMVQAELIVPVSYLGAVFDLMKDREGVLGKQEYLSQDRVLLTYTLPLRELVVDLHDQLKSATAGYGSLSYEVKGWQSADVVKISVLVNHEPVEALSVIAPRLKAESVGRRIVEKLKTVMPRQLFTIPLQAAIGGTVIARESVSAMRKDVTSGLYGGDYSRKRKLLEKQKKGKKKMSKVGSIDIPPEAYLAVLKRT